MPSADTPGYISLNAPDDSASIVKDIVLAAEVPAYISLNDATNVVPYYNGSAIGSERLAIDVSVSDVPSFVQTADPSGQLKIDIGAFPSGGSLDLSLWFIHPDGTRSPLPHFTNLTVSPINNDVGTVSISYPVYGLNFDLLQDIQRNDRDYEVAIWLFGRETGSIRAVLNDVSGDEVSEAAVWTFTGTLLEGRMKEAITYPNAADATGKFQSLFSAATPGTVMRTLMTQAHARGTLADISITSFSDTRDSNGDLWDFAATLSFSPGSTYASILSAMVGYGMCEWEITSDHELRLYNTDGRGADLTLLDPPVVLYKGRNILDGPRKYSNRDAGTTLLASGKEALYYDETDASALARRGRRIEKMAQAGNNLDDLGTVTAYVQAALPAIVAGTMELSHGLVFGAGYPLPAFGFNVGDWIWSDSTGVKERLRILQWSLTVQASGTTGTITLNDFMRDSLAKLALKLTAIQEGVVVAGTSTLDPTEDVIAPAAPENVLATSLAYYDAGHTGSASILASWDEVLLNTDGSACGDLAGYRLQYRYTTLNQGSTDWFGVPQTQDTNASWGGLSPGADVEIRVSAIDNNNNLSPWSDSITIETATDATPPPVPSTPTLSNFLGVVTIRWDGLGINGEQMPFDFDHVEVHVSTSASFAPSSSTFFGNLFANGGLVYTTTNYGVEVFACLVAVDQVGNTSAPSATAGATPNQVINGDIFDGAIGTSKLQELVVKQGYIDFLAVNDANIGDLSVGKLTAGIMTATVLLSGVIRTAMTGNRSEMDNAGIRLYDTSGTLTVDLKTSDGSALITGTYRSALSGERINLLNDGTQRFYGATGSDYAEIANDGGVVRFRSRADGSGNRAYVDYNPAGLSVYYGTAAVGSGTQYSQFDCGQSYAVMRGPVTGIRVDDRYTPLDATQNRFHFTFTDGSGSDIGSSVLHYQSVSTNSNSGNINAPARNCSVMWGLSEIWITEGTGNSFGAIGASSFNTGSSITVKQEILPIRFSNRATAKDLVQAARAYEYEYIDENTRAEKPPLKIRDVDGNLTQAEWDFEMPEKPKHYGPMAEHLMAVAPSLVQRRPVRGDLIVNISNIAGIAWEASAEAHDRIDVLEQQVEKLLGIINGDIIEGEVA